MTQPDLPRIKVMCTNPLCELTGVVREVTLTHLGQQVFAHPTVVCACQPMMALMLLPDEQQGEPVVTVIPSEEELAAAAEASTLEDAKREKDRVKVGHVAEEPVRGDLVDATAAYEAAEARQ